MKFEMKIEFNDTHSLEELIKNVYFDDQRNGKLSNRENESLKIKEGDVLNIVFKGLSNTIVRLYNNDIIDGTMRFVVDEGDTLKLIPCSTYCIVEDTKYSFY